MSIPDLMVTTVAGRTGNVILTPSDIGLEKTSLAKASAGVDDAAYMTSSTTREALPAALRAKTYVLKLVNGTTRASTDVWMQIQTLADTVDAAGGGIIRLVTDQPGVFWLDKQIKLGVTTSLVSSPGIRFRCTTANKGYFDVADYTDHYTRFPGGYMFTINAAYNPDGTLNNSAYNSAWSTPFPGFRSTKFEGIVLEQHPDDQPVPMHMLFLCAPALVTNCRTIFAHNFVMVPNIYMDGLHVQHGGAYWPWVDTRITDTFNPARQRGWITLSNSGDCVVIDNVMAPVNLTNSRGATITGGFGAIYLNGCDSVCLQGKHNESDIEWLIANNSTFTLRGSQYWLGTSPKIRLRTNSHATLQSVEWQWVMNYENPMFKSSTPEVALDNTSTLVIEDCARVQTATGNIGLKYRTGILVSKWDTTAGTFTELDDWTHYSHLLSKRGAVNSGHRINLNHSIDSIPTAADSPNMSNEGAVLQDTDQGTTWSKTGQTGAVLYWYRATYAIDWPRRFYSTLSAGSAAPTSRTNGLTTTTRVVLYPSDDVNTYGSTPSKGRYPRLLVLMRTSDAQVAATGGAITAATIWDEVALIPIQDQALDLHLFDQGDYISGYMWRAFGQARPSQYQVKAAAWAAGKFTGVISYNAARPTNAAGTDSPNGFVGDSLIADTPTGGYPAKYIKQSANAVANQQWLAIDQIPLIGTLTMASSTTVPSGDSVDLGTVTINGAAIGDLIEVTYSTTLSNCILWGYATASNGVKIRASNTTNANSQTLQAGTATIRVRKPA